MTDESAAPKEGPGSRKDYGSATEAKISEVTDACERHGQRSIIALEGVPGTGKSFMASIAAQRLAGKPELVREVQFHQSFTYEEFVEGMRIDDSGGVDVWPGVFLEWNETALADPDHKYVLLVEELSRANISAVLGELMTYLEYRDRPFLTIYSRRPVKVAKNLVLIATYNPVDQSAIEIDKALLRRMRVIRFPPSEEQLAEMLAGNGLSSDVIDRLQELFRRCRTEHPDTFDQEMPFGHGIFADVQQENPDLHQLWKERIRYLLRPPLKQPHPYTDIIEDAYPWRDSDFTVE